MSEYIKFGFGNISTIVKRIKNFYAIPLYFIKGKIKLIIKNPTYIQINKGRGELTEFLKVLKNGYKILNLGREFLFAKEDVILIQPNIGVLNEKIEKAYKVFDFKNKVVLDVGAYFGETAVIFHKFGAKKVICVEPLKENVKYILKNVVINDVNCEVINAAIGRKRGTMIMKVDPNTIQKSGFGLTKGNYKIKVKSITFNEILKRYKIDIAKVDCEGCEINLIYSDKNLIKKVKKWIIEVHSNEIKNKLIELYSKLGYKHRIIEVVDKNRGIYIIKFWRS